MPVGIVLSVLLISGLSPLLFFYPNVPVVAAAALLISGLSGLVVKMPVAATWLHVGCLVFAHLLVVICVFDLLAFSLLVFVHSVLLFLYLYARGIALIALPVSCFFALVFPLLVVFVALLIVVRVLSVFPPSLWKTKARFSQATLMIMPLAQARTSTTCCSFIGWLVDTQ